MHDIVYIPISCKAVVYGESSSHSDKTGRVSNRRTQDMNVRH